MATFLKQGKKIYFNSLPLPTSVLNITDSIKELLCLILGRNITNKILTTMHFSVAPLFKPILIFWLPSHKQRNYSIVFLA